MKKKLFAVVILTVFLLFCCSFVCFAENDSEVQLNRESINLYPSQTYRLTLTNSSDSSYFLSSDEKIVEVSNDGIVTAVSKGTATVSAILKDGTVVECSVTVKSGASPQDLTLNTQSLTLTQGSSKKISAEVYPKDVVDSSVYYYSSDESIATVDAEGNISAVKTGVAVITAESASSAVSKKCIVKVVSKSGKSDFSANVSGTLYTISGDKKDKAIIEIKNNKTSLRETTDSEGRFSFEDVPQGSYVLSFYKNKDAVKASAYNQINISSYEVNISCIINDGELVILFQDNANTGDIKDITLEKSSLILDIGESYDMTYTVRPSSAGTPALSAVSSNEKIATVDGQGRIQAVSQGKASIIYSTHDGKITKTCVVTVTSVNSNTYSWVIILLESMIILGILLVFSLLYKRYLRNKEKREQ